MLKWVVLGLAPGAAVAYSPRQRWIRDGSLLKYKANPAYCASVREGKHGDGSDIILWHCGKGKEFQWVFEGEYVKYQAAPEYCMSVREGKAGDGSDVILWKCSDDSAFKWNYEDEHMKFKDEPRYWLSVRGDKISDGADLILWLGHAAGFQWVVKEPLIHLKADPNVCIAVDGGTRNMGDGSDVVISPCERSKRKGDWKINGDLIVSADNEKYCLSVREAHFHDYQDVIMWTCQPNDEAFQWIVDIKGRIKVKSRPDYCLMIREAEQGDGFLKHGKLPVKIRNCDDHDEGVVLTHSKNFWNRYPENAFEQAWIYENQQLKLKADARYCATVREGKIGNGWGLIMWHCMDDERRQSKWIIESNQIKLKQDPTYCASVREGKGGDGSDIILWRCHDNHAYRWNVDPAMLSRSAGEQVESADLIPWADDPKYFLSVRGGRLTDGADLILWSGYGNPYQWTLEDKMIKLKVDPNLCLSVREGKAGDGSDMILWECDPKSNAFQFTVEGDNLVYAANPKFCVAVREGKYQDGADVILWTCKQGDYSQGWIVDKGRIRFKRHPNYCLTVREGRAGDGSDVIMWSCDESVAALDDEL
eukprot:TRINITY_DN14743_c0_g1_i1.p1 TRINITY_DN14743_c0_g1~~TRINITY_DN14743_c0_g1_i1.p1  ORF type:complete len:590 (+),score=132.18 TRINITY_DN14743_c0_g1_i1:102-1871(+)